MDEKNKIIGQLKPYPIEAQLQKLRELRASDKFTDIQKESRAPKGKYCDSCENLATKYEPRICSWNGETTDVVCFSYCQFFNCNLTVEKGNDCYAHYIKCVPCLMQTELLNNTN